MKIIFFILLVALIACNSYDHKATPVDTIDESQPDSLLKSMDSLNTKLTRMTILATSAAAQLREKVRELNEKKQAVETDRQTMVTSAEYSSDDRDRRLYELTKLVKSYESEIASLKNRLYWDSIYKARAAYQPPIMLDDVAPFPDENSLLIELTSGGRSGDVPLKGVSVYLVPFTRKARKLMVYEVFCDLSQLNELKGTAGNQSDGLFFFNGVEPGVYLVKVCAYYGGFKKITRLPGRQLIKLEISPPVR